MDLDNYTTYSPYPFEGVKARVRHSPHMVPGQSTALKLLMPLLFRLNIVDESCVFGRNCVVALNLKQLWHGIGDLATPKAIEVED